MSSPYFVEGMLEVQTNRFSFLVGQLISWLSGFDQSTLDLDQRRTVNDHCKEIYSRFAVNSATELAAKFLKST